MNDAAIEAEIRSILGPDWAAPLAPENAAKIFAANGRDVDDEAGPYIGKTHAGWLIVGSMGGADHAGCREDGLSLARDMAAMLRPIAEDPEINRTLPPGTIFQEESEPDADQMEDDPETAELFPQEHEEVHLPEGPDGQDEASGSLPDEGADITDIALRDFDGTEGGLAGPDSMVYPGTMVLGDPLDGAKMQAAWRVDDIRHTLVGQYDIQSSEAQLNELRSAQAAIKEGLDVPFDGEELNDLERLTPWLRQIDDHAQSLRDIIRQCPDLETLSMIEIETGWPE